MNWENLQNKMQQDASQQEVDLDVDIDDIWASIEPEVDLINQKKRKKRFFFFWFIGLGLVLVVGNYCLMGNKNLTDSTLLDFEKIEKTATKEKKMQHPTNVDDQIEPIANISVNDAAPTTPIKAQNKINSSKEDEKINSQNKTVSIDSFIANIGINDTASIIPIKAQNKITPSKEDKKINSQNKTASVDPFIANIGVNNTAPITPIKAQNKINPSKEAEKINIQNKTASLDPLNGEKIVPRKITPSSQQVYSINNSAHSSLGFSKNQMDRVEFNPQVNERIVEKELIDILNRLPTLTSNLLTSEAELFPFINSLPYLPALNDAQHKTPTFTFSLGLIGGLGMASKNLDTKDNAANSLLLIRRETESSLETIQLGLSLSLRHQSGFSFSSGLQQTTLVEKVLLDKTITEVKDIQGITLIKVNPSGGSTTILGLIPETTVTTIEKKLYVRYKLLEAPLILAWQTKNKYTTAWTFGIEGGIVPNIFLQTKGIILNENYEDVNIRIGQASYFKKNIGLSYHVGFSVSRMFTKNIELSFKPTLRFFPNDFSAIGNPISQKYILVSGQLSTNYIFGK